MAEDQINFVNTVIVPWGLIAVMFSLGLSLAVDDFVAAFRRWQSVGIGLLGQLFLLPLLGWAIVILFGLPATMAVGLLILAASPGGITSNAVIFAAKGNVALSVVLTSLASLITVVSTPLLIKLALDYFMPGGEAPDFSVSNTIVKLFQMTVLPVLSGMVICKLLPVFARSLVVWLRPASFIVLVSVIGFSVYVSAEMVWANISTAGPAILALNLSAILLGLLLARMATLNSEDSMTIGVEVGVQNATVATFLTLTVLNDLALAITPTLYGVIMIVNAFVFVKLWRSTNLLGWFRKGSVASV